MQDQVELWAKIEHAALDHPELPASFIAESLISMAEPRKESKPFIGRAARKKITIKPIRS